ncbi:MAG: heparan-alpha-glucosaminide N-acetyltransferase domain-containing protein [Candidatus Krumholzibacteria bacterium]|nr:heparan-alpha-glucosaminide N-acetyltransferase domain-containing protein [Candidatus Krumholzibacteria bacterium]
MAKPGRFTFIDRFRGLIGVMMALGHSNYYFNHVWHSLDPMDPYFASTGQFWLRYMGYLCAPGFLMMNGAMVYWAFQRRLKHGTSPWRARWELIERGIFLILVQLFWVNSSWGAFSRLRLNHFGIIATIGSAMILLVFIVRWKWWQRLLVAAGLFLAQPFLLSIPYDLKSWIHIPVQLFWDAGDYNKYPILPWFSLAVLGSVMAHFWFERWTDPVKRARNTLGIGAGLVALAWLIRLGRGFGNIFPYSDFLDWSFFLVQKYPPNLVHQVWFAGAVIFMVGIFDFISQRSNILSPLGVVGRVPLFFYAVHIPLLAIFTKRLGIYYREGAVLASFVGLAGLLLIMFPLAIWFGKVKKRSKNKFIRMI